MNLLHLFYIVFILSCLFDPDNQLLALKMPVFILIIVYTFITHKRVMPSSVFSYVFLFGFILPIISVLIGLLINSENYIETNLIIIIKPFLFIFLALAMINSPEENISKLFSSCLLVLAAAIILIFVSYTTGIVSEEILYAFGNENGVFTVGERDFSSLTINRVYFHTAPMLVFGSYYFLNCFYETKKKYYLILSVFISIALFLSGTRNDMIMSFSPYIILGYLNGKRKTRMIIITSMICFGAYLVSKEILETFFDKEDNSNSQKLSYLNEYFDRFSNISTFVLGDGLGSYFYTQGLGYCNNTELTYLELFRRFGIIGGGIYLFLMYKPVFQLYKEKSSIWLAFAYLMYLIMVIFNPFFFSSNGMMILSVVISTIYQNRTKINKMVNQQVIHY